MPANPQNNVPAQPTPFVPSEIVPAIPDAGPHEELRAVLRTTLGDITVKLLRAEAPATVAQFVGLASGDREFTDVKTSKRVKRPFYNGLIFHRVVKGYLIQTGCPYGTGRGGPGDNLRLRDEITPRVKFDRPGMLAMAPMRDESGTKIIKGTNGSQFFITVRPMPEWDGQFTIFGQVEDGMDVVHKISNVKVGPTERPIKRVYLLSVDIVEGKTGSQQTLLLPLKDNKGFFWNRFLARSFSSITFLFSKINLDWTNPVFDWFFPNVTDLHKNPVALVIFAAIFGFWIWKKTRPCLETAFAFSFSRGPRRHAFVSHCKTVGATRASRTGGYASRLAYESS